MSTATIVARKDLLELRRDRRLLVLGVFVLSLALVAVIASWSRVVAHERDRAAAEARDRTTWEQQGERNPHGAAHFSSWALRPLTALAVLDPGISAHAGSAIWMEAHRQNTALARPVENSASTFDLGLFSAAWVLQLLVPLLLGITAAGAIARERERGTLRLLLTTGASGIVPGKLLALLGTVALVVLPVLGAATLAAVLAGPLDPVRLLLWIVAYGVYYLVLAAVAIAVSLHARSASQALLVLLGVWLVTMVLLPRAGAGFVSAALPVPSTEAFWAAIAEDRAAQPKVFGKDAETFARAMAEQYGVEHPDDLPVSLAGLRLNEDERLGNLTYDEHFGALAERYETQRSLLRTFGVLTPLLPLQNLSMALSGTDLPHQLAFQAQAERHRRSVMTLLNGDLIEHGKEAGFDYTAGPDLWKRTPAFRYEPPGLGAALWACRLDLILLAAWALLAGFLLHGAARRLHGEAG